MEYEELAKAIREAEDLPRSWRTTLFLHLAQLSVEDGKTDNARRYIAQAKEFIDSLDRGSEGPGNTRVLCFLWEMEGRVAEEEGQFLKAIQLYEKALRNMPSDESFRTVRLQLSLSRVLLKTGDFRRAQEVTQEAFILASSKGTISQVAEALYMQGFAMKKEHPDVAKGCFRLCLHLLKDTQDSKGRKFLERRAKEELNALVSQERWGPGPLEKKGPE